MRSLVALSALLLSTAAMAQDVCPDPQFGQWTFAECVQNTGGDLPMCIACADLGDQPTTCSLDEFAQAVTMTWDEVNSTGNCPTGGLGAACGVNCGTLGIISPQREDSEVHPLPEVIRITHTDRRGVVRKGLYVGLQEDTRNDGQVYHRMINSLQDLPCTVEHGTLADVNGDGETDLLAGAPSCGTFNEGTVYVYLSVGEGDVRARDYDVAIRGIRGQRLGSKFAHAAGSAATTAWVGYGSNTSSAYAINRTNFRTSRTSITSYSRSRLRWGSLEYWDDRATEE